MKIKTSIMTRHPISMEVITGAFFSIAITNVSMEPMKRIVSANAAMPLRKMAASVRCAKRPCNHALSLSIAIG